MIIELTYNLLKGRYKSAIEEMINSLVMIGLYLIAARITKPDILFDIVSEGGAGFQLFEYCAQKICILK